MTLEELRQHSSDALSRTEHLGAFLQIDENKKKIAELEQIMSKPDFWDDKAKAQETVQQLSSAKGTIEPFLALRREVDDFAALAELAAEITARLGIVTIGIGAGVHCDGQVLVISDILGLGGAYHPKFAKQYADIGSAIAEAARAFKQEVCARVFPDDEHSYLE